MNLTPETLTRVLLLAFAIGCLLIYWATRWAIEWIDRTDQVDLHAHLVDTAERMVNYRLLKEERERLIRKFDAAEGAFPARARAAFIDLLNHRSPPPSSELADTIMRDLEAALDNWDPTAGAG